MICCEEVTKLRSFHAIPATSDLSILPFGCGFCPETWRESLETCFRIIWGSLRHHFSECPPKLRWRRNPVGDMFVDHNNKMKWLCDHPKHQTFWPHPIISSRLRLFGKLFSTFKKKSTGLVLVETQLIHGRHEYGPKAWHPQLFVVILFFGRRCRTFLHAERLGVVIVQTSIAAGRTFQGEAFVSKIGLFFVQVWCSNFPKLDLPPTKNDTSFFAKTFLDLKIISQFVQLNMPSRETRCWRPSMPWQVSICGSQPWQDSS